MSTGGPRDLFLPIAVLCGFCLAAPLPSRAQAWVPPKGEGSFSFGYQNGLTRDHVDFGGKWVEDGTNKWHGIVQFVEYGLTDKIALDLSLPFYRGVYHGPTPHAGNNTDDGTYHGAFQDFRFNVRYNIRRNPLMITPFVGMTLPSHNYEFHAHSAVGKKMREVAMGANLGRVLDPLIPRTYFQEQISYVVSQRIAGYRPNRSQVMGEFGVFVTRRLSLQFLHSLQLTHSGCDWNYGLSGPTSDDCGATVERELNHDKIVKSSFLNLGGGFSLALSDSWSLFGSMQRTAWMRNGHVLNRGFTFGFTRSFRTGPERAHHDH